MEATCPPPSQSGYIPLRWRLHDRPGEGGYTKPQVMVATQCPGQRRLHKAPGDGSYTMPRAKEVTQSPRWWRLHNAPGKGGYTKPQVMEATQCPGQRRLHKAPGDGGYTMPRAKVTQSPRWRMLHNAPGEGCYTTPRDGGYTKPLVKEVTQNPWWWRLYIIPTGKVATQKPSSSQVSHPIFLHLFASKIHIPLPKPIYHYQPRMMAHAFRWRALTFKNTVNRQTNLQVTGSGELCILCQCMLEWLYSVTAGEVCCGTFCHHGTFCHQRGNKSCRHCTCLRVRVRVSV